MSSKGKDLWTVTRSPHQARYSRQVNAGGTVVLPREMILLKHGPLSVRFESEPAGWPANKMLLRVDASGLLELESPLPSESEPTRLQWRESSGFMDAIGQNSCFSAICEEPAALFSLPAAMLSGLFGLFVIVPGYGKCEVRSARLDSAQRTILLPGKLPAGAELAIVFNSDASFPYDLRAGAERAQKREASPLPRVGKRKIQSK